RRPFVAADRPVGPDPARSHAPALADSRRRRPPQLPRRGPLAFVLPVAPLALGEPFERLPDPLRARLRALGARDPLEVLVAVRRSEPVEELRRRRVRRQRDREILRNLDSPCCRTRRGGVALLRRAGFVDPRLRGAQLLDQLGVRREVVERRNLAELAHPVLVALAALAVDHERTVRL